MGISNEIKANAKIIASDVKGALKDEIATSIQTGEHNLGEMAARGIKEGTKSWLSRSVTGRAVQRIVNGTSTLDDFFEVADSIHPLFKVVHKILNTMRHASCEQLRYEDMIKGALQNRPKDPNVAGCCVLQEMADQNTRVVFIYIDKNDEPIFGNGPKPYGFYLLTKSFDEELNEAFGGKDMIVIK